MLWAVDSVFAWAVLLVICGRVCALGERVFVIILV